MRGRRAVGTRPCCCSPPLTAPGSAPPPRSKKLKFKKNFAVIQECVSLWEKLRPHDVAAGERRALVQRVLDTMRGQLAALANNHAASRVVQAVIKVRTVAEWSNEGCV